MKMMIKTVKINIISDRNLKYFVVVENIFIVT